MTVRRNFKRRVRDRQALTGERYTAARRRLLAERAALAASPAVPVVELRDISAEAARLGFRCRISVFPALADRADSAAVLAGLRDALIAATRTPMTAQLFAIAFGLTVGPIPLRELRGLERMRRELRLRRLPPRLEIEAAREHGLMIFAVAGRDQLVRVLCMLWEQGTSLLLTLADDHAAQLLEVEA